MEVTVCIEKAKGLKNNEKDNVATVFGAEAPKGSILEVVDPAGSKCSYTVLETIPYGHKIAIEDVRKGEQITKYGESIGIASEDIRVGQYVHVHNVESARGRGDWNKREGAVQ